MLEVVGKLLVPNYNFFFALLKAYYGLPVFFNPTFRMRTLYFYLCFIDIMVYMLEMSLAYSEYCVRRMSASAMLRKYLLFLATLQGVGILGGLIMCNEGDDTPLCKWTVGLSMALWLVPFVPFVLSFLAIFLVTFFYPLAPHIKPIAKLSALTAILGGTKLDRSNPPQFFFAALAVALL